LIKKLDILIIKSFIGPFIVTFFVTLFVLVMQFFWLYMDELLGKGLGAWMIIQLLFYMSTTLVPLALPLGIVLASIMTFGNLGENFELVAIKSAGISLLRFMRPLLFFIILISALAFVFSNNVIPYANLKALSLLYDLRNSKPAFNLRAGQFNQDIENYSIRVGEKDDDGSTIRNIIIYDHTSGMGNDKVTIAEEGQMISTADKSYMIFRLKDGWRYEEYTNNDGSENNEQVRMYFKQWDKVFDLSSFKLQRTNQDLFKNAYQMMNVRQLAYEIDSADRYRSKIPDKVYNYISPYVSLAAEDSTRKLLTRLEALTALATTYDSTFITLVPDSLRIRVLQLASSHARSSKNLVEVTVSDLSIRQMNYATYKIEWHRKFTLSFACVLLFLIGAPLGAIIRKGGLGMPLVVAIAFFVVFHIMSITGEKLARTEAVEAWIGMWMATAMLLPIAFVLIGQARNDSQVFSKEWYIRIWNAIRGLFKNKK
ncbi:MAG TPA: LptF/LptG family permease, partial [Flavipsychrobacter sp.]|nr:LptF/LptG family permease [Flavipsychrobacter sp.]